MTDFHRDEDLAEAVAMLLTSRLDYLPALKVSTGLLAAPPGPQASRFVPCEACAGTGRLLNAKPCHICRAKKAKRPNHGCTPCWHCDSTGQRRRRHDEEGWDAYSGKTMAELASMPTVEVRRAALAAEPLMPGEHGWLRERERMARDGSYADLERAIERLPSGRREQILAWAERGGHDAEGRAMNGMPVTWSVEARLAIAGTLELLAAGMARPVRVPGWVVRSWRSRERSVA